MDVQQVSKISQSSKNWYERRFQTADHTFPWSNALLRFVEHLLHLLYILLYYYCICICIVYEDHRRCDAVEGARPVQLFCLLKLCCGNQSRSGAGTPTRKEQTAQLSITQRVVLRPLCETICHVTLSGFDTE